MSAQWYYAKGSDKHGPISGDELKERARDGQIQPTDLVWKTGMPDWKPANCVKGIFVHVPNAGQPTFQFAERTEPNEAQAQAPDLGSAVKGLFAAVTAKVKGLGTKATDAAVASPPTPVHASSDLPNHSESAATATGVGTRLQTYCLTIWNAIKHFWIRLAAWSLGVSNSIAHSADSSHAENATGAAIQAEAGSNSVTNEENRLLFSEIFCGDATARANAVPRAVILGNVIHWFAILVVIGSIVSTPAADLEISQEKYLRPAPTVDLESILADSGVPLTLMREDEALRVWKVGNKNLLAVSGPTEKLTGVFLVSFYSTDSTNNMTSAILAIHAFGSTLNPEIGSGEKWSEGENLMQWCVSLMESKKSGERFVHGKRVVFTNLFPLGYQLSISPEYGTLEPSDVFAEIMDGMSQPDSRPFSADEAKKNLLETAKLLEGPFVAVVLDIVDAVESGDQPLSVADGRMYESGPGKHHFSAETIEAYKAWRIAWLAEWKRRE